MNTKTLVRGDLAALWDGDDIVVLNRQFKMTCRYTTDFLEKSLENYDENRWGKRPTLLERALNLSERGAHDYIFWDYKSSDYDRLVSLDPFHVAA